MSTALIGGLALQGTPQDYSNVAARREQAAAAKAAKPNREQDAIYKKLLSGLRTNVHEALFEEVEGLNADTLMTAYDLFQAGDLNQVSNIFNRAKDMNTHAERVSKFLTQMDSPAFQKANNLPPGWSDLMRSAAVRAGGQARIQALDEFFSRPENEKYKEIIAYSLDGQGRFNIAFDAQKGRRVDADNVFTKKAGDLMGQAFIAGLGETVNSDKFRLGGTNVLQNVQRLSVDRGVEIFDQEAAADPAFRYNAELVEPGLKAEPGSEEHEAAKRRFVERNLPANVREYIDRIRSGSGSSDRSKGEVSTDRAIVLRTPGGEFSFNTVSYSIPQKVNVSMNVGTAGSFKLGTEGTYTELSEKEREATDMGMQVSSIDIIPVYTGQTKAYRFVDENGSDFEITLRKGMPVPVDNINRAIEANPNVNKELSGLTYEYRPFATALGAQDVAGAKTETYVIPLTDANRNRITANTTDQRLRGANWKQAVFGEYASQIGQKGAFGTGSVQPRQQAAPAPTPQGGASQQRGAGNPGISKLTPIN
jgi:hypothetical protein